MNQQGCWFGAVTSLAYSVQITDIVNPMFHGICVVMYPWPEKKSGRGAVCHKTGVATPRKQQNQ